MLHTILQSLIRNTILCTHHKPAGTAETGQSKLGGVPDLPEGFAWPWYEGTTWDGIRANRPMSFLAQIDLAQVHPLDTEGLLPETGLLSFFYERETMTWGFDPADGGSARVVYTPAGVPLIPTEPPEELDPALSVPQRFLRFHAQPDLPDYETFRAIHPTDPAYSWDIHDSTCRDLGIELCENCGTRHKLLGYPDLIQNEIFQQCAMVTSGLYCGAPTPLTPEQKEQYRLQSRDWLLLFQLSSFWDGEEELMFGDMGSIYFCIRREDLAARRFDRIWLILQCG